MRTIRFASPEDAPVLLAIYAPYVRETGITFEESVPTEAVFRRRVETISAAYPYLVCEEDGRICGYAYAHRQMERAAYRWNAELSVYVAQGCGGRGIGTALYERLLPLLVNMHVRNVYAVVAMPNESSAALHRRFGFAELARFPAMGYKLGRWRDVVWYGKVLCEEAEPSPLLGVGEIG